MDGEERKHALMQEKQVGAGVIKLMRAKVEEHREITGLPLCDLEAIALVVLDPRPIPIVTACPHGHPHVDEGEWITTPHRTHQCQAMVPEGLVGVTSHKRCGAEWRPSEHATIGVVALS